LTQVPEYDLSKPDSLTVLRESDVVSDSEAKWFRRQLKRIAGTTLTGQPRLRLVWGVTHVDEMSTLGNIKYLDFAHEGVELGERRWFIEIHRSPDFLAASGRYQAETRQDEDGTKLLKSLPADGCYDYWLRLELIDRETGDHFYCPLDHPQALETVRALWRWEQAPQSQRDDLERANRERERRQHIEVKRRQRNDLWGFDPDLFIPETASDGTMRFVRRRVEI
jgi:hypothetical protein